ncbi:MAG: YifB family Mg chelatase-like AAA ATPase [Treponema sp.]|jgi:magnesium chelatase family protein|nr:YifB family Mg chelatase-like AAA ATPase [Treponema sp.]
MYVTAYTPHGAGGILIRVETDIRRGIPGIDISGLAEGAVKEARERVRAAFRNSGLNFPLDRVLINLAPAGIRKEGTALDLPMALSVMAAADLVPGLGALSEQIMVMGELELSGRVRPVRGALAAVAAGLAEGVRFFILPRENENEAAMLLCGGDRTEKTERTVQYAAVSALGEAAHALILLSCTGAFPRAMEKAETQTRADPAAIWGDFAEARGQERYKRALEIAAAGGHNLLVFGPPGTGKTLLARRYPSITAPLGAEEALEVTRLHSLAGLLGERSTLITEPPFRSPHHSASAEGILGGGKIVRPGEISLAHLGALFLDEAPEFRINVLQSLREPLEDGVITISRAEGPLRLPADFQLILAANACPCGRLGTEQDCFCSPDEVRRYWRKFSGALLDRVELRAPALSQKFSRLNAGAAETSAAIRARVCAAVEIQRRRFAAGGESPRPCRRNAGMSPGQIEQFCPLGEEAEKTFRRAVLHLSLSGRAYHGILRVARTIADLEGSEMIGAEHILEAVQHRRLGDDPYDVLGEYDA